MPDRERLFVVAECWTEKSVLFPSAYDQPHDSGIKRAEDTAQHPSVSRTGEAIIELTSLERLKCDDRQRSLMYHFMRTFTEPVSQAHPMTSDGSSTIPWSQLGQGMLLRLWTITSELLAS